MRRYRHRPRRLNLAPQRLDARLEGWGQGLEAALAPEVGAAQVGEPPPARIDWFQIVEELEDHVSCLRRSTAGAVVLVAKPPDLQGAVASREFGGETHEITPAYTAGGLIWGVSLPGGGGQGYDAGAGTVRPYEWLDLNRDARQWAKVPA